MSKKWFTYKIHALNFIPGVMLGLEFPSSEELGDWFDDTKTEGQITKFCFVLDLFIVRYIFNWFSTTEDIETE